MSDKIKVGDRVLNPGFGERTVVAVDGNSAWIRDKDGWQCVAKLSNLTRIEPEPGTLSLGQVVRRKRDADRTGVVTGLEARIRWGDCLYENVPIEVLEPVPTPCPTCKGSGKSSE